MLNSSIRKLATLATDGMEPYEVGKHNFDNPLPEFEALAALRAITCMGCRYFRREPIEQFRVVDARTPELSEMMCGKCGCELSYKTRQDIKVCSKWPKR